MRPLAERNQTAVGAFAVVLIGLMVMVASFSDNLPLLTAGTTYSALFSEAAGLKPGDPVQAAGVKVGSVDDVSLQGGQARVSFTVHHLQVGNRTTLSIQILTLLGQKTLALDTRGSAQQLPSQTISSKRTTSPFDVSEALQGLGRTAGKLDSNRLAHAFDVVADTLKDAPSGTRDALSGLSALSRTISSRNDQLAHLLSNASNVSKTVADRNKEVQRLLRDGGTLLRELQQKEQAIDSLLDGTRQLAQQLSGLVNDNDKTLHPALQQLEKVSTILSQNQDHLAKLIHYLAPYVRLFTNTVGTGRWFSGYICGLLTPRVGIPGMPLNNDACSAPNYDPTRTGVTNR